MHREMRKIFYLYLCSREIEEGIEHSAKIAAAIDVETRVARMRSIASARARNRSLAKPVTSVSGRNPSTVVATIVVYVPPLSNAPVSNTPHPIHRIGNRIARDARREAAMTSRARETWKKKTRKKEKGKLETLDDQHRARDGKSIAGNIRSPIAFACFNRVTIRTALLRSSIKTENNKSSSLQLIKVAHNRMVFAREKINTVALVILSQTYSAENALGKMIVIILELNVLLELIVTKFIGVFLDPSKADVFLDKLISERSL